MSGPRKGPLAGLRAVEFAGLGPVPFAGMMLADMGAEVILVDRKAANPNAAATTDATAGALAIYNRGKRSIALDLKQEAGREVARALMARVDLLIEGFRPGVMERLGLGPEEALTANPKLVYGRVTGWGQSGPLSQRAGHDLTYLGLSGALHYDGAEGARPFPPVTMLGDVAGGAMSLVVGLLAALHHVRAGGDGQVVDAAICDGASYMATLLQSLRHAGLLPDDGRASFLTGAAPWYNTYRCADGGRFAVGALEPAFYAQFIARLGLEADPDFAEQMDRSRWPAARAKLDALFQTQPRAHWITVFDGADACVAPVLTLAEAAEHPHAVARSTFVEKDGLRQPAPAPRFEATPSAAGAAPPMAGADTDKLLNELGFAGAEQQKLRATGCV